MQTFISHKAYIVYNDASFKIEKWRKLIMSKPIINEMVLLRTIACLTVVLCHSLESALAIFYTPEASSMGKNVLYLVLMATFFATPAFVFMSEFLLGKKYHSHIPNGFLRKRAKYLLLPYLFMSIVYGFINAPSNTPESIFIQVLKSVFLADSTVYFIIIIFQFYVLHAIFYKKLNGWNPFKVLIISLILNVLYLSIFNFIDPPTNNDIYSYIWRRGYYIPFFAWIFYFSLGFYVGKNFELIKKKISANSAIFKISLTTGILFMVVIINRYFKIIEVTSSKRVDMLLYTTCVIFLVFALTTLLKRIPTSIIIFSNYSFSIYLLHKIFIGFFESLGWADNLNIIVYIVLIFILSVALSVFVSYLLNLSKFGKFLVGQNRQLKIPKRKKSI